MSHLTTVEVKMAPWLQVLVFGLALVCLCFVPPLLIGRTPTPIAGVAAWIYYVLFLVTALWVPLALLYALWRLRRFRICADDERLLLQRDGISQSGRWDNLASWAVEPQGEDGSTGWWIKLRDATGTVVLEWNRGWCQLIGSDAELMAFIKARLAPYSPKESIEEPGILRVRPLWLQVTGWLALCFFCFLAYRYWSNGNFGLALIMLGVSNVGTTILLLNGTVEVSARGIAHLAPLSRKRIDWAQVTKIQTVETNEIERWVFHGEGKAVSIPGPRHWWGRDKAAMLGLITKRIRRHQIAMEGRE